MQMGIVRVFVPSWRAGGHDRYLRIANEKLLDPRRWIRLDDTGRGRSQRELKQTKRLREQYPPSKVRRRTIDAATKAFLQGAKPSGTGDRRDVEWTVQSLRPDYRATDYDPLLYKLYERSIITFGEKAARDLYIFDVGMSTFDHLNYYVDKPSHAPATVNRTGRVDLRIFAILRQLSHPPFDDFEHTLFSPLITLAAVLLPSDGAKEQVLDVALDVDDALFFSDGSPSVRRSVDELMVHLADSQLRVLFDHPIDGPILRYDERHTAFSAFVLGLCSESMPQWYLTDPITAAKEASVLNRPANISPTLLERLPSRARFLSILSRLCLRHFRITKSRFGLWKSEACALWLDDDGQLTSLRHLVHNHFPRRSSLSVLSDVIFISTPGRLTLIHSLDASKSPDGSQSSYGETLDDVAWIIELVSLVTRIEVSLDWLHSLINEGKPILDIRRRLREFDDFYDIGLFDLPRSAICQAHFNDVKYALSLDHQYDMFHRKLEIMVSDIHSRNLTWAVVAVVVAVLAPIIGAEVYPGLRLPFFAVSAAIFVTLLWPSVTMLSERPISLVKSWLSLLFEWTTSPDKD